MKRKFLILLCLGMLMMTGCAEKGDNKHTGNDDTKDEQADGIVSEVNETFQSQERQEQEDESISIDNIKNVQNDENIQDLYMQFINNEVPVIVDPQNERGFFNLEKGSSYTFAEFGQYINQNYFDAKSSEEISYDYAQYTFVNCLDSDSKNLLIKFVGMNIYEQGDDSFTVYVITENNGQLYLTDQYECWARSDTIQFGDGVCDSVGANGAENHIADLSVILSDGKITDIYKANILSGWSIGDVDREIYLDVFDQKNIGGLMDVWIYTIDEDKYYAYDISKSLCTDDWLAMFETYINRCHDEAGINWSTDEELQEAIKKRCHVLGIDDKKLWQQEEVEWITL